mmetsp:Transcript_37205/g.104984  ORF Transcript_37205/g.104984 Transcript_37205/m.104984 type:complete len:237 (+) Transcript_37205:701-1411(+)
METLTSAIFSVLPSPSVQMTCLAPRMAAVHDMRPRPAPSSTTVLSFHCHASALELLAKRWWCEVSTAGGWVRKSARHTAPSHTTEPCSYSIHLSASWGGASRGKYMCFIPYDVTSSKLPCPTHAIQAPLEPLGAGWTRSMKGKEKALEQIGNCNADRDKLTVVWASTKPPAEKSGFCIQNCINDTYLPSKGSDTLTSGRWSLPEYAHKFRGSSDENRTGSVSMLKLPAAWRARAVA